LGYNAISHANFGSVMTHHGININSDKIADFCRRHHVKKLSLFGSILREDFRPESDVDILVEFESGHEVGMFTMAALEIELSGLVGRKVDLRTPAEISRHFRADVVKESEVQYGG
jgi:uncharacterized protein